MIINGKSKNISIVAYLLVLCWMGMIFFLSAQPAKQSSRLSMTVSKIIVDGVYELFSLKMTPGQKVKLAKNLNPKVRKISHMWLCFVLGILVVFAFRKLGITQAKAYGYAFGLCVLYAISDELHQLFVSGRGGMISDVLLDSAGALSGLGVYWAYSVRGSKEVN